MTVRDDRGDVKQTTTGFRGPLMVQSLTSAKSKFLSLQLYIVPHCEPATDISIEREDVFRQFPVKDDGQTIAIKYRRDQPVEKHFRHRLKHLFQKHRIPPWQRPYTPQVYLDDELIGLWVLE